MSDRPYPWERECGHYHDSLVGVEEYPTCSGFITDPDRAAAVVEVLEAAKRRLNCSCTDRGGFGGNPGPAEWRYGGKWYAKPEGELDWWHNGVEGDFRCYQAGDFRTALSRLNEGNEADQPARNALEEKPDE